MTGFDEKSIRKQVLLLLEKSTWDKAAVMFTAEVLRQTRIFRSIKPLVERNLDDAALRSELRSLHKATHALKRANSTVSPKLSSLLDLYLDSSTRRRQIESSAYPTFLSQMTVELDFLCEYLESIMSLWPQKQSQLELHALLFSPLIEDILATYQKYFDSLPSKGAPLTTLVRLVVSPVGEPPEELDKLIAKTMRRLKRRKQSYSNSLSTQPQENT